MAKTARSRKPAGKNPTPRKYVIPDEIRALAPDDAPVPDSNCQRQ